MRGVAVLALIAFASAQSMAAPDRNAKFDIVQFFTGRTHGEGELRFVLQKPLRHSTDTVGKRGANGDLILLDTIHEQGKPAKERRWVMRPDGPNRFSGTVSDAVGPVHVTVDGREATIRYTMKGGISIDQRLTMLDDPKTVLNRVTAKRLGVRVARLEAKIRKLD